MAAALAAKVLPFDLFETRRLIGAAVGIVGLFVTWRIGRRIGGPVAGLVALVLLATCPLYYGHMFINAEGRALRHRHGGAAARPGARLRRISAARARARSCSPASASGSPSARASWPASPRRRDRRAAVRRSSRKAARCGWKPAAQRCGQFLWTHAAGPRARLSDHGPAVAVVGASRRSIRCTRRNISTRFSKSRGRNCTKAG